MKCILLLIVIVACANHSFCQTDWSKPLPSKHTVGYKCVQVQNRSFCLWYPANENQNDSRMPYVEYGANDFNSIKKSTKFALGVDLSDADIQSILNARTVVVKDAQAAGGSFPLIIALQQDGPSQMSLLYEYLAGQGLVVVMSAPNEEQAKRMMSNFGKEEHRRVANERVEDVKIIRDHFSKLKFVDKKKFALLGVNSEGIPALLYQMKYGDASAVTTIDWLGSREDRKICFIELTGF